MTSIKHRLQTALKAFWYPEEYVEKKLLYRELRQSIRNPEYVPEILRAPVDYAQHVAKFVNQPFRYGIKVDDINDGEAFLLCIHVARIIESFLKSAEQTNITNDELYSPDKLKSHHDKLGKEE